jgi:hypothetical protein
VIIDWNRRENRNGIGNEEDENNLEEISLKDEGRGKIGREFKGTDKRFRERKSSGYRIRNGLTEGSYKMQNILHIA